MFTNPVHTDEKPAIRRAIAFRTDDMESFLPSHGANQKLALVGDFRQDTDRTMLLHFHSSAVSPCLVVERDPEKVGVVGSIPTLTTVVFGL